MGAERRSSVFTTAGKFLSVCLSVTQLHATITYESFCHTLPIFFCEFKDLKTQTKFVNAANQPSYHEKNRKFSEFFSIFPVAKS